MNAFSVAEIWGSVTKEIYVLGVSSNSDACPLWYACLSFFMLWKQTDILSEGHIPVMASNSVPQIPR